MEDHLGVDEGLLSPVVAGFAEHILADAILAPLAQAAIAPKISAPVKKFYVQRGAKVKEGELLATLETLDGSLSREH